jgi:PKD repeat protein
VNFDASPSYDPDGNIVLYEWDFGDGGTATGKIVAHTFAQRGTYLVTLTVTDQRGHWTSKIKTVEAWNLFSPLNVRWETFVDQSLFQTRYLTEVSWEKNPKNDGFAQVVAYKIYRKKTGQPASAFSLIAKVEANTFRYTDSKVEGRDLYAYAVTAVDSSGHESPIEETPT